MGGDNESDKSGNVSDTLNAAANLAKAVPVYDDAVQPLAKETGKALGTVGRCVNAALMPVRGLVWSAEKIEEWVSTRVAQKLENIDPEKIVTPDLSVAGPTIEALKFNGHKEELSEMFAALLATAMNSDKLGKAHPSFVSIISEMTSLDASVFRALSKSSAVPSANLRVKLSGGGSSVIFEHFCPDIYQQAGLSLNQHDSRFGAAIDNLQRHSLISVRYDQWLSSAEIYEPIEKHPYTMALKNQIERPELKQSLDVKKGMISLTAFGRYFADACLSG